MNELGVSMRRRFFLAAGGAALLSAGRGVPAARDASPAELLADVETGLGGRIGVAALDTGSGARLAHRARERFAMCSTFKWVLAASVLSRSEADPRLLGRRLTFGPQDLLAYAPVTSAHLREGRLSIRSLCEAAVEVSDNTAANLLLNYLGGPAALTDFLRRIGDPITRLDRNEPELNSNLPDDLRDTTTPDAMLASMRTLLLEQALSAESRRMLLGWMRHCRTGAKRLRAGLPQGWVTGDKTGTGDRNAANDVAIVWPPYRAPILIVAYLSGSPRDADACDAAHARIAGIVAAAFA